MNWAPQILSSIVYLAVSSLLVFAYSFFIPSLGHLQEFGFGEGVLNLDLCAPWGMVVSAALIGLLFQTGKAIRIEDRSAWGRLLPVLYFAVLWAERSFYILRDHETLSILVPLLLSLFWIPLFLWAVDLLSEAPNLEGGMEATRRGAGWGVLFFWTAVFFSFSIQLILRGYGSLGSIQALVFLGLSYLEYRKLLSTGLLNPSVDTVFMWFYRGAAVFYMGFWVVRSTGVL